MYKDLFNLFKHIVQMVLIKKLKEDISKMFQVIQF